LIRRNAALKTFLSPTRNTVEGPRSFSVSSYILCAVRIWHTCQPCTRCNLWACEAVSCNPLVPSRGSGAR